jgi:hypothetical protein
VVGKFDDTGARRTESVLLLLEENVVALPVLGEGEDGGDSPMWCQCSCWTIEYGDGESHL